MIPKLIIVCLVGIAINFNEIPVSAVSQPQAIHVSADEPLLTHVEPHLWVDPANSQHIVIAVATVSGQYKAASTMYNCHVLSSKDGGITWKRAIIPDSFLDPWLAASATGKLYLSTLQRSGKSPVVIYESADGGGIWNKIKEISAPDAMGSHFITKTGSYDRPGIVTSQKGDLIYITAMQGVDTIYGQEITGPVFLSLQLNDLVVASPVRLMHSNVWSNVSNPVLFSNGRVGFAYSDFGVDEARTKTRIVQTKRTWWAYTADSGKTFSIPFLAAETSEPSTLALSAVSTAEKWKDRVYLIFADLHGVYLTYSDSYGEQWSEKFAVATDSNTKFANAVIAAGSQGEVGAAWYDNRDSSSNCWNVWFSKSKDGGQTFSEALKLNQEPHCTEKNGAPVESARRWAYGGDYFGITTDQKGRFHVAWCDARTGVYQLFYTKIEN